MRHVSSSLVVLFFFFLTFHGPGRDPSRAMLCYGLRLFFGWRLGRAGGVLLAEAGHHPQIRRSDKDVRAGRREQAEECAREELPSVIAGALRRADIPGDVVRGVHLGAPRAAWPAVTGRGRL